MDGVAKAILLVEDSDDDAELTARAFARAGVRTPITRVCEAEEALENLLERAPDQLPIAMLLDLNLPRMGGLQLLQMILGRRELQKIPVIVMTSSKDDEDRLTAYERGAVGFVRKPVDFEAFVDAVARLGLHWSASLSVFGTAAS